MATKTQERLKAQARVLKALAHPTRLLLVEELARQTRCVCELRDAAGLDISTVYCRYHFVVDVLAGVVTAAVLVPTGNWLYFKYQQREQGES